MEKIRKLSRKGFTLVEVITGFSMSLLIILAALLSFINCMFLNETSRNIVTAANDVQYVLEQIKAQSFSNIPTYISNYSSAQFNNLSDENISFPNPIYGSNLDTITVQVNYNERNTTKTLSITTYFAQ